MQIFNSGNLTVTGDVVVIQGRREAPLWQGTLSGCMVIVALIAAIVGYVFISELPGFEGLLTDPKQLIGAIGLTAILALPILVVVAFVVYSERPAILPRRGILAVRQQGKTLAVLVITAHGRRPGWYAFAISSEEEATALAARLQNPRDTRSSEYALIAIQRKERAVVLRRRELREAACEAQDRLRVLSASLTPIAESLPARPKITTLPGHGLLLTGPGAVMLIGHSRRLTPWWLPFAAVPVVLGLMLVIASLHLPAFSHLALIIAMSAGYQHLRTRLAAPPVLPRLNIWSIRVEGCTVSFYGTPDIQYKARWYTFTARCEEEARGIERNLRVRVQGRQRRYPVGFAG